MTVDDQIELQIKRFSSHPGLSSDRGEASRQVDELTKAFRSIQGTPKLIEAIADRMMRQARYFPLPVDVELAADQVRAELVLQPSPVNDCPHCGGMRFLPHTKILNGVQYDFARPCSCVSANARQLQEAL